MIKLLKIIIIKDLKKEKNKLRVRFSLRSGRILEKEGKR
jgi:hypothetical protein